MALSYMCIWWLFGDFELHVSCGVALSYMWVAFGGRLETLRCMWPWDGFKLYVGCIWWPFGDLELHADCGVALSCMWAAFSGHLETLSCIWTMGWLWVVCGGFKLYVCCIWWLYGDLELHVGCGGCIRTVEGVWWGVSYGWACGGHGWTMGGMGELWSEVWALGELWGACVGFRWWCGSHRCMRWGTGCIGELWG